MLARFDARQGPRPGLKHLLEHIGIGRGKEAANGVMRRDAVRQIKEGAEPLFVGLPEIRMSALGELLPDAWLKERRNSTAP